MFVYLKGGGGGRSSETEDDVFLETRHDRRTTRTPPRTSQGARPPRYLPNASLRRGSAINVFLILRSQRTSQRMSLHLRDPIRNLLQKLSLSKSLLLRHYFSIQPSTWTPIYVIGWSMTIRLLIELESVSLKRPSFFSQRRARASSHSLHYFENLLANSLLQ